MEAEGLRVRKDGSRFWASVVIDAIYDEGRLIGFAKVTRDVTERKAAESQLRQALKMEAIGRFTRSEEHTSELQSPCNLVCRLLLEKKKHDTEPLSHPPELQPLSPLLFDRDLEHQSLPESLVLADELSSEPLLFHHELSQHHTLHN